MTSTPVTLQMAPRGRRPKPPRHLADLSHDERVDVLAELGHAPLRAKQLATHYFTHLTADPERMTDLPAAARGELVEALLPQLLTPVRTLTADRGKTVKSLWRLFDGVSVESVLMRYPRRATLCISSQVGCGMACPFCATGQLGLTRNLSVGEIVEQVRLAAAALEAGEVAGGPGRLTNIVFMGMGEPLANYKTVMGAVRRFVAPAPEGFGMSARNVTVSTVGLVPAIDKLAAEGIPVTLALSLHAPDDALRSQIMPVNNRYPIARVLEACEAFYARKRRKVFVEYVMLAGVNDRDEQALQLAELLDPRIYKVNLIPYNPTGTGYDGSSREAIDAFRAALTERGLSATVRLTRGRDIDAACGQLAANAAA